MGSGSAPRAAGLGVLWLALAPMAYGAPSDAIRPTVSLRAEVGYPMLAGGVLSLQHGESVWATELAGGVGLFAALARLRFGPVAKVGGTPGISLLFYPTVDVAPAIIVGELSLNGGMSGTLATVFWGPERRHGFDLRLSGGAFATSYQGGIYPQVQLGLGWALGKRLRLSLED